MTPRDGGGYSDAVLDVLAGEFPHLADATLAAAVEHALAHYVASPHPTFACDVEDLRADQPISVVLLPSRAVTTCPLAPNHSASAPATGSAPSLSDPYGSPVVERAQRAVSSRMHVGMAHGCFATEDGLR